MSLEYSTNNKYTVYFNDGTSFESSGSSSSVRKSEISNEFKWVSFHIKKELLKMGKSLSDVQRIDYTLEYKDFI